MRKITKPETRSERLFIRIKPSVKKKLEAIAKKHGVSPATIIEQWVEEEE